MNAAVTAISSSVPMSADSMPARSGEIRDGKLVRKSTESLGRPSLATV